jgi:putative intracellular protease/amidase
MKVKESFMPSKKNKIAVLIEEHFDETEYHRFNDFFPKHGYEIEYISNLWNQPSLSFNGNDHTTEVKVTIDFSKVKPTDYAGIILIGGYAMDRLRYQENIQLGQANQSPAVEFLRQSVKAMDQGLINIGTICHSLWLFCADTSLLKGREVTCAHNIVCDVENAGGTLIYKDGQTVDIHIDDNLITGKHPGIVDKFMQTFLDALDKRTNS